MTGWRVRQRQVYGDQPASEVLRPRERSGSHRRHGHPVLQRGLVAGTDWARLAGKTKLEQEVTLFPGFFLFLWRYL